MFDYTHRVINSEGIEFGIFKSKSHAELMRIALEAKFKEYDVFTVELIK